VRRICAWCGVDVGPDSASKNPEAGEGAGKPLKRNPSPDESSDSEVTSTICRSCASDLAAYRKPVLVVSREWARMYDQLVELLRGHPEIQVILDRRQPSGAGEGVTGWKGPDRRRRGHPLVVK
jgi:hypothetical protein